MWAKRSWKPEKSQINGEQGDSAAAKTSQANLSPRSKINLGDAKISRIKSLNWFRRDRPSYFPTHPNISIKSVESSSIRTDATFNMRSRTFWSQQYMRQQIQFSRRLKPHQQWSKRESWMLKINNFVGREKIMEYNLKRLFTIIHR